MILPNLWLMVVGLLTNLLGAPLGMRKFFVLFASVQNYLFMFCDLWIMLILGYWVVIKDGFDLADKIMVEWYKLFFGMMAL